GRAVDVDGVAIAVGRLDLGDLHVLDDDVVDVPQVEAAAGQTGAGADPDDRLVRGHPDVVRAGEVAADPHGLGRARRRGADQRAEAGHGDGAAARAAGGRAVDGGEAGDPGRRR